MKIFLTLLCLIATFTAGLWAQKTYTFWPTPDVTAESASFDAFNESQQISKTLTRQSKAWSAGDIDAFMQDYWKSDDLRFASGGTVKRGWQTTSDRYKTRYPDKATMGSLAFSDLEVEVLAPTHALVFGRWTLTRDGDAPTGLFTLHMEKQNGAWKIVSDHTSSATP